MSQTFSNPGPTTVNTQRQLEAKILNALNGTGGGGGGSNNIVSTVDPGVTVGTKGQEWYNSILQKLWINTDGNTGWQQLI